ncbi:hypothetical protein AVEN_44844-1 [Araneus ventricosus]|uniref:Uncharacterized protein n=1 Tax=Araneus ventricosus TaxID=182803 RepID=A0A4Y2CLU6_ARAVE|nr:hypothetical protein AVEN_44844-1 [Araneus ventricosus]
MMLPRIQNTLDASTFHSEISPPFRLTPLLPNLCSPTDGSSFPNSFLRATRSNNDISKGRISQARKGQVPRYFHMNRQKEREKRNKARKKKTQRSFCAKSGRLNQPQ